MGYSPWKIWTTLFSKTRCKICITSSTAFYFFSSTAFVFNRYRKQFEDALVVYFIPRKIVLNPVTFSLFLAFLIVFCVHATNAFQSKKTLLINC